MWLKPNVRNVDTHGIITVNYLEGHARTAVITGLLNVADPQGHKIKNPFLWTILLLKKMIFHQSR